MMGIELPTCPMGAAALPVAGVGNEQTHERRRGSIHRVQRNRALRRDSERRKFFLKKESLSQGVVGQGMQGAASTALRAARSDRSSESGAALSQCPYSLAYINDSMAQHSALPGACSTARSRQARTSACSSGVKRSLYPKLRSTASYGLS